jgi:hypothetical protein
MRQFVLTRSAYGPAWDVGANRRRLAITRAVTARLMAAQTERDWTWVVLLDERDPLLAERLALYGDSAPQFEPIVWIPTDLPKAEGMIRQRIAAADYRAPWRSVVGPADDTTLQTRLDDDDGLAPDALTRVRTAAAGVTRRTILMLPTGVRVWRGCYVHVRHERNAMHTLVTPPGDAGTVYDYGHTKCAAAAPIVLLDDAWGWLWVRHRDTISGYHRAHLRINPAVRAAFPVDWAALRRAWNLAA